jgi:hypothetical protein
MVDFCTYVLSVECYHWSQSQNVLMLLIFSCHVRMREIPDVIVKSKVVPVGKVVPVLN